MNSKLSENIKLNLDKMGMTWEQFYEAMEDNSNYWRTRRYNPLAMSPLDCYKVSNLFNIKIEIIVGWCLDN
jgi:hypothetical protein